MIYLFDYIYIYIYVDFHGECNVGKYTIHGSFGNSKSPSKRNAESQASIFRGQAVSFMGSASMKFRGEKTQHDVWADYNDVSRCHPKWWFNKGTSPKSPKHSGLGIIRQFAQHDVSLSSLFLIIFSFNLHFFHSRVIKGHQNQASFFKPNAKKIHPIFSPLYIYICIKKHQPKKISNFIPFAPPKNKKKQRKNSM